VRPELRLDGSTAAAGSLGIGADGTSTAAEAADDEDVAAYEAWVEVKPHVAEWIERLDASGEPPDAEPLLRYARALVDAARLDDLGHAARFVARACGARAEWRAALREFAVGVDQMVRERYHGATFAPLDGIRRLGLGGEAGPSAAAGLALAVDVDHVGL